MSDLFWLTDAQTARPEPFFPKSHGKPSVDDRRVLSGIIAIIRKGLRWRDAPAEYGPHQTLYIRWKRGGVKGVFAQMKAGLAGGHGEEKTVIIDATYLKAHRTATRMGVKKRGGGRLIVRTKGGMNTKLHAICDSYGRPLSLFVTAGPLLGDASIACQAAGQRLYRRAGSAPQPSLCRVASGGRGYDADWFRETLKDKGIRACIPGRKQRNRIKIMFGRLKDWRRMATRSDRCPKAFLSAIALAATVIYWL